MDTKNRGLLDWLSYLATPLLWAGERAINRFLDAINPLDAADDEGAFQSSTRLHTGAYLRMQGISSTRDHASGETLATGRPVTFVIADPNRPYNPIRGQAQSIRYDMHRLILSGNAQIQQDNGPVFSNETLSLPFEIFEDRPTSARLCILPSSPDETPSQQTTDVDPSEGTTNTPSLTDH